MYFLKKKNVWMVVFKQQLLLNFSSTCQTEKAMAPHSSTLDWKIPWTEEPERLQSMGWLRVRHDWATSLSLFTFMHWRRKWQPTPVFLPGEFQGRRSLVGCHLWDRRIGHNWSDLAAAVPAKTELIPNISPGLRWQRICMQGRRPRFNF